MESNGGLVVTELSHIKELVRQLEVHLGQSPELCKHLVSQIFFLTERSIVMITSSNLDGGRKRSAADAGLASATPSPLSNVADVPFKTIKKRKMMEKRKHQVRVNSAGGGERPVDDGHSWRKYGQKEILGAKHPRGYYRCTHRHSQGCAATKQVQRTDDDSALFDVIYHGKHTCVQRAAAAGAGQPAAATQSPEHNPDAHSLLQSLSANLTVKTDGLSMAVEPQGWSTASATPFCFSSTPASGDLAREWSTFFAASTPENWGVSPATSDSNNVVSLPPLDAAEHAEWRAQSEHQEMVSALVEAATCAPEPTVDMDFVDEFFNLDP